MKLSIEELKNKLVDYIGEDTSDKAIELLEDFSDSTSEYTSDIEWETRYNELDAEWRKKYIERFTENRNISDESSENEEVEKSYKYDDLFNESEVE